MDGMGGRGPIPRGHGGYAGLATAAGLQVMSQRGAFFPVPPTANPYRDPQAAQRGKRVAHRPRPRRHGRHRGPDRRAGTRASLAPLRHHADGDRADRPQAARPTRFVTPSPVQIIEKIDVPERPCFTRTFTCPQSSAAGPGGIRHFGCGMFQPAGCGAGMRPSCSSSSSWSYIKLTDRTLPSR
jgi:hypothetical protein